MLIRSLGAKHPKILALIRNAPPGAEDLVLRMLEILSEKGKTSPALISLIRSMAAESELKPRYLIPILPELTKVGPPVYHLPSLG